MNPNKKNTTMKLAIPLFLSSIIMFAFIYASNIKFSQNVESMSVSIHKIRKDLRRIDKTFLLSNPN